jgi:hypothetical protein
MLGGLPPDARGLWHPLQTFLYLLLDCFVFPVADATVVPGRALRLNREAWTS